MTDKKIIEYAYTRSQVETYMRQQSQPQDTESIDNSPTTARISGRLNKLLSEEINRQTVGRTKPSQGSLLEKAWDIAYGTGTDGAVRPEKFSKNTHSAKETRTLVAAAKTLQNTADALLRFAGAAAPGDSTDGSGNRNNGKLPSAEELKRRREAIKTRVAADLKPKKTDRVAPQKSDKGAA